MSAVGWAVLHRARREDREIWVRRGSRSLVERLSHDARHSTYRHTAARITSPPSAVQTAFSTAATNPTTRDAISLAFSFSGGSSIWIFVGA